MKWIGALLFLATTTWVGFEWSNQLNKRPAHIRQLKSALQILEAEILYSQLPLQEAFHVISSQIPEPTQTFFTALYKHMQNESVDLIQVWTESVASYKDNSALEASEEEILIQFGRTLGQYDFQQQQKYIHIALSHLDRELNNAESNQHRYGKMAKSLGFLCGLFIVLLLI